MVKLIESPGPAAIRAKRLELELGQAQAAELAGVNIRSWQKWESGECVMPAVQWTMLLLWYGQHPDYLLTQRRCPPA